MIIFKDKIMLGRYPYTMAEPFIYFRRDEDDKRFYFNGSIGSRFWTAKDILAYAKAGDETYEQVLPDFVQVSEVDPINNTALYLRLGDTISENMERLG